MSASITPPSDKSTMSSPAKDLDTVVTAARHLAIQLVALVIQVQSSRAGRPVMFNRSKEFSGFGRVITKVTIVIGVAGVLATINVLREAVQDLRSASTYRQQIKDLIAALKQITEAQEVPAV